MPSDEKCPHDVTVDSMLGLDGGRLWMKTLPVKSSGKTESHKDFFLRGKS